MTKQAYSWIICALLLLTLSACVSTTQPAASIATEPRSIAQDLLQWADHFTAPREPGAIVVVGMPRQIPIISMRPYFDARTMLIQYEGLLRATGNHDAEALLRILADDIRQKRADTTARRGDDKYSLYYFNGYTDYMADSDEAKMSAPDDPANTMIAQVIGQYSNLLYDDYPVPPSLAHHIDTLLTRTVQSLPEPYGARIQKPALAIDSDFIPWFFLQGETMHLNPSMIRGVLYYAVQRDPEALEHIRQALQSQGAGGADMQQLNAEALRLLQPFDSTMRILMGSALAQQALQEEGNGLPSADCLSVMALRSDGGDIDPSFINGLFQVSIKEGHLRFRGADTPITLQQRLSFMQSAAQSDSPQYCLQLQAPELRSSPNMRYPNF